MIRVARFVYLAAVALFDLGVVVQLFLVGLIVVAGSMGFDLHRTLGHLLAAPLLVMLVAVHLGRLPAGVARLSWLLFALYVLQADVLIFLRSSQPLLAALHPVLALADIVLGWMLLLRGWSAARIAWSGPIVPADTVSMPEAVSR